MRLNVFLILTLLVIVILAPVVDAIACDDCKDIIPLRDMQQRLTNGADHAHGNMLSSDADSPAQQGTDTAQDLCPVCANIAAAMGNACCGAPSMISQTNHLPKLIALIDPSYSIIKPPQN
jgi:hypothetical protein